MAEKQRGKFNKQQGRATEEDDFTEQSHQKARKEALLQASRDSGYKVAGNGYAVNVTVDKRNAYKELESLQKAAIANYSNWAQEELKYNALESDGAAKNLKQYNDTYTMTMLMGVIAPLERGCDMGSVLQCMMSYNIIRTLNPNLDMDSSRMYYNFRNTIAPMVSDLSIDHPVLGKLLGNTVLKSVDRTLSSAGGAKLATTIDAHEKVHDIDSMYLTPRQVAALKLNFMEQYYSDLRSTDDEYVRNAFTADYAKAMKHLEAICNNGGYDMSVVAAEERYLVGLKMEKNPNYATMFNETYDPFGVRINHAAVSDSGRWFGQFAQTDEHEWFGGKDIISNGAFHVRMPMTYEKFCNELKSRGTRFDDMRAYIDSAMWTDSDDSSREELLAKIDAQEKAYLEEMKFIAKTDGLKLDSSVENLYANARSEVARDDTKLPDQKLGRSEDFAAEMDSVIRAKVIRKMGYDVEAMRANSRHKIDTSSDEYVRMSDDLEEYAKAKGIKADNGDILLQNIEMHYFEDLSTEDKYALFAHTIANIEQGEQEHHSNRDGVDYRAQRLSDIKLAFNFDGSESTDEDSFELPES